MLNLDKVCLSFLVVARGFIYYVGLLMAPLSSVKCSLVFLIRFGEFTGAQNIDRLFESAD